MPGIFTKKAEKGEAVRVCEKCRRYIEFAYREFASTERDHYCSLECWREDYPLPTKTCKECGEKFSYVFSQLKHRAVLYCSWACYQASKVSQKVDRKCEQCGSTFQMYKGELKHRAGRFCNRVCWKESLGKKE